MCSLITLNKSCALTHFIPLVLFHTPWKYTPKSMSWLSLITIFKQSLELYILLNLLSPVIWKISGQLIWEVIARRCSVKKVRACNFIKKETLAHVFSCEFCEISKNNFSSRRPPVAASVIFATLQNMLLIDKLCLFFF